MLAAIIIVGWVLLMWKIEQLNRQARAEREEAQEGEVARERDLVMEARKARIREEVRFDVRATHGQVEPPSRAYPPVPDLTGTCTGEEL